MAHEPKDDIGDIELLLRYRMAVLSFLHRKGFHNGAEDVASDMVACQWARMRAGSSFRPRGMTLPAVLQREAIRWAKQALSLVTFGELEWKESESSVGVADEAPRHRELMTALKLAFTTSEVEGMTGAAASG